VAQGLAGSVHDIPLADDIALISHKSGHNSALLFSLVSFDDEGAGRNTRSFVMEGSLYFCPQSSTIPLRTFLFIAQAAARCQLYFYLVGKMLALSHVFACMLLFSQFQIQTLEEEYAYAAHIIPRPPVRRGL